MPAYRGASRACALCRSPTRAVPVDAGTTGATVDVCDDCGAVFLEYFDGEPAALSRAMSAPAGEDRSEVAADGAPPRCPDCEIELELRRYLDAGPHVYRCGGCMAVVATRTQLRALRRFRLPPETPDASESFLAKLLRLVGA